MATRGLLVVVACALQHLGQSEEVHDPPIDQGVIEELMESFSFSEIKKRSLEAKYCTILCESVSDKTTLLELGGLFYPLRGTPSLCPPPL